MTEAELDREVARLAAAKGIWGRHMPRRTDRAGIPDWVLIGRRGILWRENKTETGVLSGEQETVARMLCGLGQDWGVWRPRDLLSGRINAELEAIR